MASNHRACRQKSSGRKKICKLVGTFCYICDMKNVTRLRNSLLRPPPGPFCIDYGLTAHIFQH